jgi:hypothetical protein
MDRVERCSRALVRIVGDMGAVVLLVIAIALACAGTVGVLRWLLT